MASEAEWFVHLVTQQWALRRVQQSQVLKLSSEGAERLKVLDHEVTERRRRMGGSVRRKVNALLAPLGYPLEAEDAH